MNPDTYRFVGPSPDEPEPPTDWPRYSVGEHFTLRGIRFRVQEIDVAGNRLVMVPDKPDDQALTKKENFTGRLERMIRQRGDRG